MAKMKDLKWKQKVKEDCTCTGTQHCNRCQDCHCPQCGAILEELVNEKAGSGPLEEKCTADCGYHKYFHS